MYTPISPEGAPLDVLRHYRGKNAEASYVSLQFYSITDLVPLMLELAQLKNMTTLILSHNSIAHLPEDMSMLKKLETLDLTSNPIRNASSVLRGLFSLPKLRNLRINLPDTEEEQLVATLSQLTTLNGVSLEEQEQNIVPSSTKELMSTLQPPEVFEVHGYHVPEAQTACPYVPWTSEEVHKYEHLHNVVSKISGAVSHPEEYLDFQRLVCTHLRSRTKAETDIFKRQIHQYNAATLLLEYSFDELVRCSGRYGQELQTCLTSIFDHFVTLTRTASATLAALQEDRDRKIAAIQEDLAKELLTKERARIRHENLPVSTDLMDDVQRELAARQATAVSENVLTLPKLLSTLELIMESKRHHDEANVNAHLPKETLEQHIYSYYYGRTSTDEGIKRAVTCVFNSVKRWSSADINVEVFGLILRNELPEMYWYTHRALTNALFDAVHSTLVSHGIEKERGDPSQIQGMLDEDLCREVVDMVFPHRDNSTLLRTVSNAMRRTVASELHDVPGRLALGYREFVQTVLRANMAIHMLNIAPIVQQFHALDPERSGIIDDAQFRVLLDVLLPGISSLKVQELLSAVDPFSNNVVNFSDVVRCLASGTRQRAAARSLPARSAREA